jgi:PPK2 family polyphosphate:nucleotide phosphotransferase
MEKYRVSSKDKIKLKDWDPNETSEFSGDKATAKVRLSKLNKELDALQELLYAEGMHKVLIVLQGMDTGGKDGTIRSVFEGVNPQGVKVASFKVPTPEELAHDFLWRVHKVVPGKGEIVIFNRSQYEEVLVVRVHNLVPKEAWKKHYAQINAFERMLAEEGTLILKFFLFIDLDEQKQRLTKRLENKTKQWKFSIGDLAERKLWPAYMKAYEDMLNRTSTSWAPWYIVPANHKWYRNLVVAEVLVNALKGLKMSYPAPKDDLSNIVIE